MTMNSLFLALAASILVPPARAGAGPGKLGPEWSEIKSAESSMKSGSFVDAEGSLKKALSD